MTRLTAFLRGFGQFWYDFIIGDDYKIAVAVVTVLTVGAICVITGVATGGVFAPLLALGIAAAFVTALLIDIRRS